MLRLSSGSKDYRTPKRLYEELDAEFHFQLDAATTKDNPLGTKYFYTEEDDALSKPWNKNATFCNPPYGLKIGEWVRKGYLDSVKYGVTIVMLLPSRTDTRWFHAYIYNNNNGNNNNNNNIKNQDPNIEHRFLKGRLRFEGTKSSAPSLVCIFRGGVEARR